jgi:hypothetical protein
MFSKIFSLSLYITSQNQSFSRRHVLWTSTFFFFFLGGGTPPKTKVGACVKTILHPFFSLKIPKNLRPLKGHEQVPTFMSPKVHAQLNNISSFVFRLVHLFYTYKVNFCTMLIINQCAQSRSIVTK